MVYLRMLLFFLSFFGIYLFIKSKLPKLNKLFFPLTVIFITFFLYIFSLISLLRVSFILLLILGIVFLIYFIIKKEINYKDFISIDNAIILLFFIYLIFITKSLHNMHYDNYTHWQLIVKLILESGNLPKTNHVLSYLSYPPGSAVFISYFSYICGKHTDGMFIIAQNIIAISFFKGIYNLIKTNHIIIKRISFIVIYLLVHAYFIQFNDLLVDHLVLLTFALGLFGVNEYKNNKKNLLLFLFILIPYMYLIKNIGLFFGLILSFLFYRISKNKKYTLYLIFEAIASFFIWTVFAFLTYGKYIFISKHSLNVGMYLKIVLSKGITNCIIFYIKYLLALFNVVKYTTNLLFFMVNIILLLIIFVSRKNIKEKLKKLLKLDLVYIIYFIVLGLMYVLSMPQDEAWYYACYDRYMMVPLFLIIFYVISVLLKEKKIIFSLSFVIVLFISLFFKLDTFKVFLGIDNYTDSRMYKYNNIVDKVDIDINNRIIGIYAEEGNFDDFLTSYTVYKLRTKSIVVYKEKETLNKYMCDYIIVYDGLDNISDDLYNLGYRNLSNGVYKKNIIYIYKEY